ncbi:TrkA family potassium uptake protein [Sulfurimonas sp. SAG-AH-194-I05]|nr:TrkA C-terminal domain-containing protein [Sulfurimonas sp. SAG-AH-194-I05]MDF1874663.1 TrkA family potassium uptake protein [Sulfurimonas sp. SAG-AH-194-I05]
MKEKYALIFGHNDYTLEIKKNIVSEYEAVYVLSLEDESENSFDLSDDWDTVDKKYKMKDCVAFCILEDMAENIFLTISLRDTFKDLTIVALAKDKEGADKLTLAGASRVLPTTQTTANVIVEMLEKPIVTEVLHNILYEESDLKIAQIKIKNHELFDGKHLTDIDWSREHGIIVISVVHEDGSKEFIYSAKSKHHKIKMGDIFVVVGYEQDIKDFEKLIGNKND